MCLECFDALVQFVPSRLTGTCGGIFPAPHSSLMRGTRTERAKACPGRNILSVKKLFVWLVCLLESFKSLAHVCKGSMRQKTLIHLHAKQIAGFFLELDISLVSFFKILSKQVSVPETERACFLK